MGLKELSDIIERLGEESARKKDYAREQYATIEAQAILSPEATKVWDMLQDIRQMQETLMGLWSAPDKDLVDHYIVTLPKLIAAVEELIKKDP